MTSMTVRTPWHLWVVGGISLLWNGFGAFDFVMTTTQGEAYLRASGFDQPMIDYFAAMPNWMYVPWVLGVWGGLLAAILLLIRNRLAAPVFALSLLGAVGSLVFGLMNPMPELPEAMAMMKIMPWVIAALAAFQAWYAWTMSKAGVLR
jgi:hypothetical protein